MGSNPTPVIIGVWFNGRTTVSKTVGQSSILCASVVYWLVYQTSTLKETVQIRSDAFGRVCLAARARDCKSPTKKQRKFESFLSHSIEVYIYGCIGDGNHSTIRGNANCFVKLAEFGLLHQS